MAEPRVSVKNLLVVAIFTAASAGFGLIKLPGPVGSIALDSWPGFFTAAYFTPIVGGIVGFLGHLASAAVAGFPLGPAHVLVAFTMFCWCWLFGFIIRQIDRLWALFLAGVVAVALNAVGAPLILALAFSHYRPLLSGLVLFLLIASTANVVIAGVVFVVLSKLDIPGL